MTSKTIFFDIDGTLLGRHDGKLFQIPQSAVTALHTLKQNGHRIAICSGRQEGFIRKFFPGLFDSYVAMNGTHVVFEGQTVTDLVFSVPRVREIMEHFAPYPCSYVFLGKSKGWAHRVPERHFDFLNEGYGLPDYLLTEWKPEDVEANMMDFVFESEEEYQQSLAAFTDNMILNRHPGVLAADLSFKDWDKARGIEEFLRFSGIRKEDTVAFGDGYNDITMMSAVGTSVAMGNAVAEVKDAASYVTTEIFDDGIYNGLKHLGLI